MSARGVVFQRGPPYVCKYVSTYTRVTFVDKKSFSYQRSELQGSEQADRKKKGTI